MNRDQVNLLVTLTAEERDKLEEASRRRGFRSPNEYVRALIEADAINSDDLDYEDDEETILQGVRDGLRDALEGNVRPIAELWDSLDDEE